MLNHPVRVYRYFISLPLLFQGIRYRQHDPLLLHAAQAGRF
jgi:hypothetical protein